ncbi:MAG: hypothetical protein UV68_C0072G0003 [Candidatus Collierbacteria bacterium GW2011_GWC2_43_12]|uniref:Uncharacterized protein n=1 Tax=Candidatus Collierbacteria bacterium GW2011_GWC2_43_12 TaxID=1618390 RepID=A0A0G1D0W0_9BACT|nr:MAG: hypothetical protein UV68_C0072G0003 [Candidatus Collierbacteria bacterium GW2011_GWC2_43_12]
MDKFVLFFGHFDKVGDTYQLILNPLDTHLKDARLIAETSFDESWDNLRIQENLLELALKDMAETVKNKYADRQEALAEFDFLVSRFAGLPYRGVSAHLFTEWKNLVLKAKIDLLVTIYENINSDTSHL